MLIFIKMRKELYHEIEIPSGVEVRLEGDLLIVKGKEGENKKNLKLGIFDFRVEGNKIILGFKKATKNDKRLINTFKAHIENMIKGVQNKFEYKVKICSGHFPFTVKHEGNQAIIKNFLGEKHDRKVKIPLGAEIQISKDIITIKSVSKEIAGQAAANFETITKIRGRDKRIFQDGIYIIEKDGRAI